MSAAVFNLAIKTNILKIYLRNDIHKKQFLILMEIQCLENDIQSPVIHTGVKIIPVLDGEED